MGYHRNIYNSSPAVLDKATDMWLFKNAVFDAQLQDVATASCRLEVRGEVGNKLIIKNPHLITSSVRNNHLCDWGHLPIIKFLHHPLCDVERGVALSKWYTTKDKSLSLPRWSYVV